MKIIDVNIEELSKASRRGRARSPETQQLLSVIDSLKGKTAKAFMVGPGETVQKIRARIAYAGRLAGKRLQIAVESDRVLFALSNRPARKRRQRRARRAAK